MDPWNRRGAEGEGRGVDRADPSVVVFVLATPFLAFGALLLADLLVRPQWPSLLFVPLLGVGLILVAFGFWARRHRNAWLARRAGPFAGAFVGLLVLIALLGTGRDHVVVHEMKWSYGEPAAARPGAPIVLTYCAAPDFFEEFASPELARFLEDSGQPTVEVELDVTRDFGRVRGYSIRRIGPFANPAFDWIRGSCRGPCAGSPLERSAPSGSSGSCG